MPPRSASPTGRSINRSGVPKRSGVSGCERKPDRAQPSVNGGPDANKMNPLTLRTKLTLFYSITVSLLLTGFALVSYRVLSVGLDNALRDAVIDRVRCP